MKTDVREARRTRNPTRTVLDRVDRCAEELDRTSEVVSTLSFEHSVSVGRGFGSERPWREGQTRLGCGPAICATASTEACIAEHFTQRAGSTSGFTAGSWTPSTIRLRADEDVNASFARESVAARIGEAREFLAAARRQLESEL